MLARRSIVLGPPAWVLRGPVPADLYFDFLGGRFYQRGVGQRNDPTAFLSVSRASTDYAADAMGRWFSFANNVLRWPGVGVGPTMEEARTNVVLWNRVLTNAAWTKTNVTAALDQTGIDGAANSASSITATAGNGTVLQAITLASSARWQSAFVKRITGSGTINMTIDNGTTWTAVTVTSAWTRVEIPTQTLANPTVGFRIVTNGDAIAVDFVQNENSGVFATSPILTTTAAATRAADLVTLRNLPTIYEGGYSLFYQAVHGAPAAYTANQTGLQLDDGTLSNRAQIYRHNTDGFPFLISTSGGSTIANPGYAVVAATGSRNKHAGAWASANYAHALNGNAASPNSNAGALPVNLSVLRIGSAINNTLLNGQLEQFALWSNFRMPDSELVRITS